MLSESYLIEGMEQGSQNFDNVQDLAVLVPSSTQFGWLYCWTEQEFPLLSESTMPHIKIYQTCMEQKLQNVATVLNIITYQARRLLNNYGELYTMYMWNASIYPSRLLTK